MPATKIFVRIYLLSVAGEKTIIIRAEDPRPL